MIPSSPSGPSASSALLTLMIVGHVLADFLVHSREDAQAEDRGRGYGSHGIVVFATHLVVLLPLLSVTTAAAVAAVAVVHVSIDWIKCHWIPQDRGPLKPFALDQAAHVVVVLAAWAVLARLDAIPAYRWLSADQMSVYLTGGLLAAAFAFNATGGSVIVAGILDLLPEDEGEETGAGYPGAGRMIGMLERTLMLALVLYGQWAAIALLITAKSIARFEEIKVRKFAEYYLIGTLMSILVALVVGLALKEIFIPLTG